MAALTVACLEVGDYLGMGRRYVDTLASMCERHLPPHRFVCLSDRAHSVETITLHGVEASWWAKLQLFRPGLFTGDTLYFDLDVVIDGDLHGLVELLDKGDFWALDDFAWPISHKERIDAFMREHPRGGELRTLLGGAGTCNSSVMLWRDEAGRDIWEQYSPERVVGLHGDQNYITQVIGERLHIIPPGWARSYRYGGEGPICVYHGDPKPHEVDDSAWH